MAKNLIFSMFLIIILLTGLVSACAQPAPAPAPAPAPTPAPAPAPLPTVNWNVLSIQVNHEVLPMPQLAAFAKSVEERTDGKIKIHTAVESELGIHRDSFNEAVASGVLELCHLGSQLMERVIPSMGIHQLPQLAVNQEGWDKVLMALSDFEQAEMKKFGFQAVSPEAYYIEWNQEMYTKDAVADMSDLDGLKVRVWQTSMENLIAAMNGEPVYMSFTEVFMALQRGVVDGLLTGPPAAAGSSVWDVCSQYYPVGHPGGMYYLVVSNKVYETLPDEYKIILAEEGVKWGQACQSGVASEVEKALVTLEENGMTMNELTAAERDTWRAAAMSLWDEWAKEDPTNAAALEIAKEVLGL